jgi:predicted nucleic acid-binding protein
VIFVDSNILIDILDRDPAWYDWSTMQMTHATQAGRVTINHIVLAEVAPFAGELNDFLAIIEPMGIEIELFCNHSAYQAGLAFQIYRNRRRNGQEQRLSILPDFLIGGHAQTLGATILTRDPRFYRSYFPDVPLITPLKDKL